MPIPFVIDNQQHHMSDALNELLSQTEGKPLDIASAYFAISGYRLVKDGLHQVGALRLLLGAEPHSGTTPGPLSPFKRQPVHHRTALPRSWYVG